MIVSGNGFYLPGDDWFNDYFAPASQDPGTLPVEDQAVVIGYDFISDPIVGRGTPTKPRRSGGRPIATRSGEFAFMFYSVPLLSSRRPMNQLFVLSNLSVLCFLS